MDYAKKAVRGTLIVLVLSLLAAGLGYVVRSFLAKNMSVSDFGLFYSVFSFLALLSVVRTAGFDRSMAKFVAEYVHKGRPQLAKGAVFYSSLVQLVTNTILIATIYFFSSTLAVNYFRDPRAEWLLVLMAIAFFIDSFVSVLKYSFQGILEMRWYAGIDVLRMIVIITVVFLGFRMDRGLEGAAVAYIISPLTLLILGVWMLFFKLQPEWRLVKATITRTMRKSINHYSFFVMATSFGAVALGYTDSIMLTYYQGLEQVGLYNVAMPIAKVLAILPYAVMGVLIPLTAELWIKGEKTVVRSGLKALFSYCASVMLPAVILLMVFADDVVRAFFGESYVGSTLTLQILCIGILFETFHILCYSFFAGIGKPQINSSIVYIALVLNLIGNIVLIPTFGIVGAAISTTLSYLIMMLCGMWRLQKILPMEWPTKDWLKLISLAFLSAVPLLFLQQSMEVTELGKLALWFAWLVFFFVGLIVLGIVKSGDLKLVSPFLKSGKIFDGKKTLLD